MNFIQRLINKSDILSRTNDISIYNTYLEQPLDIGPRIPSPFRRDTNPSFGFFQGTKEVCWKDFSTGETGDCFEFVKRIYPNFSYFDTLSKIATDLELPTTGDFFYKNMSHIKTKMRELSDEERNLLIAKANNNLMVKFRGFNEQDALFWHSNGISYDTLLFYKVKPISHIFINDNIIVADTLAYAFEEHKDGEVSYKIYQPFNIKGLKWLSSHDSSVWQGWTQLPPTYDEIIITKSLKDVMALASITKTPAVALQSENTKPKDSVIEELKKRFKTIYVLYDNDFDKEVNIGRLMGADMINRFNCGYQIEIPDRYKAKDFSDLVKMIGPNEADIVLSNLKVPF